MARRNRRKQETPEPSSSEDRSESKEETSEEVSVEEAMPFEAPEIAQIGFKQIYEQYWFGMYGLFMIVIDTATGFINATHLCKLATKETGVEKKYSKWIKSKSAIALIRELKASGIFCPESLEYSVTCNKHRAIRGTYIYHRVFPHLVIWSCAKFAVIASDIINQRYIQEALDKQDELHLLAIGEKDTAYGKLSRKMDRQAAKSDKKLQQLMDLTGYTHSKLDRANRKLGETTSKLDETNHKLDKTASKLSKTNQKLDKTTGKLSKTTGKLSKTNHKLGKANRKLDTVIDQFESAKDRRVMDLNTDSEHHLLLFRTNCDDDDDVHYRNYATIRAQEKSVKQAIRILMKKYPDAELILELVNVPNAMRIWNTYRSDHKHHLVNFNTSRTSFDLARGYTEAMLVRDLKHTYQKRMDTNELFSDDESE